MPTMCIHNLKDRLGNYVRHCWGTVLMASVGVGWRRRGRRGVGGARMCRHRPRSDATGTGLAQTQPAPAWLRHNRPRPRTTRPGPKRQRDVRITRRRRWGASCRRERPTRRTPRRSGSPARGRTRAATGPCDARSSRSSTPCRSRCGGSGPSPA